MNARDRSIRNGRHQSHAFIGLGPTVYLVIMNVIIILTGIIQIDTLAIRPFGTPADINLKLDILSDTANGRPAEKRNMISGGINGWQIIFQITWYVSTMVDAYFQNHGLFVINYCALLIFKKKTRILHWLQRFPRSWT